jgi:1,4-dihydroxy-2-naphthoyl-CoA hydrolase
MSLADTVGAVCAFLNLPAGAGTATVESATN